MLQCVDDIAVWVEGGQRPKLSILHQQHRSGSHAHTHKLDDVWMSQLTQNGDLNYYNKEMRRICSTIISTIVY